MNEPAVVFVALGVAVLISVTVLALVSRRSSGMREMLRAIAVSAGWADIRNMQMRAGVRGTWRSFATSFAYINRQKSVPQRLVVDVRARSDVRLIIKRRFPGLFSNRPLSWFGPPLVEVHAPAAAPFWVRTDEVNLVERLFADSSVAAAIDNVIVARYDELRVSGKGLRIVRALDEKQVREKYGFPRFTMRMEPGPFEPLAREEWTLAEALVGKLSMM